MAIDWKVLLTYDDTTKTKTAVVQRLSITLFALELGTIQIEYYTGQHRVVLQLCAAQCLCSLAPERSDDPTKAETEAVWKFEYI